MSPGLLDGGLGMAATAAVGLVAEAVGRRRREAARAGVVGGALWF